MIITLTPEQEELINQEVADGDFANASEVIDVALRLLTARRQHEEPMSDEELRHELARADAQFARGEYRTLDKQSLTTLLEEIEAKSGQRMADRQKRVSA